MSRRRIVGTGVLGSSGNVFLDLGIAEPDKKKTKVQLAIAINRILRQRKVTQDEAARLLQITQPKVSALANFRLAGFSAERLMNFVNALGQDVEIVIRPTRNRRTARIRVTAA